MRKMAEEDGVPHDQMLSETAECEESARGLDWDANFIIFLATDEHRWTRIKNFLA